MENGVWLELEVLTEIVIGVMAKVSGGGQGGPDLLWPLDMSFKPTECIIQE